MGGPRSSAEIEVLGRSRTEHRVTYAEVDRLGFVYYACYLHWFEVGRCEYLRRRGKSYRDFEDEGFGLPVIECNVRYLEPVGYDELVTVETAAQEVGPTRVRFSYRVVRAGEDKAIAEAFTVHACVDPKTHALRKVPVSMRETALRREG